jgi:hypothetical protein
VVLEVAVEQEGAVERGELRQGAEGVGVGAEALRR